MEEIEAEIIRSARKTFSLEVKPDGSLIARVPYRAGAADIKRFLEKHAKWAERKIKEAKKRCQNKAERLSEAEMEELFNRSMKVIPERVAYYAGKIGVRVGRITIRNQRTRWGSCSAKGNLNFNCLLMLTPMEVIDSVVVHELCHLKELNHSKRFYDEVLKAYPEYYKWNKWLKENGPAIMARMV